jgi:DNA-binding MarR family transcriptional regulator
VSTPDPAERDDLHARLQAELEQTIAAGILLQQAVADRLGLNLADFKCLTALSGMDAATAGDVAARTGLTTGATTRMIDRLERGGWVRREPDRHDRRKVIVRPVPEKVARIGPLFAGMSEAWAHELAGYDEDQIAMILDLFRRMRRVAGEQAAMIRKGP